MTDAHETHETHEKIDRPAPTDAEIVHVLSRLIRERLALLDTRADQKLFTLADETERHVLLHLRDEWLREHGT